MDETMMDRAGLRTRPGKGRWTSWGTALALLSSFPALAGEGGSGDDLFTMSLDQLVKVRIVSSARKREEPDSEVPISESLFPDSVLADYDIRSFTDLAALTPNLSFAYGNGFTSGNPSTGISTARTIAIRGLSGARTTGVYIDDTPLPSSIDPRIVDLSSIEVLKGPQGTLYGESSLGGNVRYLTRQPDLDHDSLSTRMETGLTEDAGTLDKGAEAIGNVVLAPDKAAIRFSASGNYAPGYLSRAYLSNIDDPSSPRITVGNQGSQGSFAGSLASLLKAGDSLSIEFRLIGQTQHDNGFPASWAPPPSYGLQSVMDRISPLQPYAEDRWSLPSLTTTYAGEGWTLTSTSSFFQRRTQDYEDSSEGTLQLYGGLYPPQPFAWTGQSENRQVSHETRVAFDPQGPFSGTFGVFYSRDRLDYHIPAIREQSTDTLLWVESETNIQQDLSAFGELYYKFLDDFTLTLGARQYWLNERDDHTVLLGSVNDTVEGSNGSTGVSPKIALSYHAGPDAMLYVSRTKGFRQGNSQLDPDLLGCQQSEAQLGRTGTSFEQIKPDSLWSDEVGGKFHLPDPGLDLSGALFHTTIRNFQQPILLASCGLFVQGNVGEAEVDGGEIELSGRLADDFRVRLGLGYEDARVTEPGNTGQAAGSPIYQVPKWTASLGGVYSRALGGGLMGFAGGDYSYTGSSVSDNNGSPLTRRGYGILNLKSGVDWGKSEISLNLRNLTNARPDLGDITYVGYGLFTDSSRTTPIPQIATMLPRTVLLVYRRMF